MLERLFGAAGHSVTLATPIVPDVTLTYTILKQIIGDIDDARVYGGIHFRFDQDAGARQGRDVAKFVIKNNLRRRRRPKGERRAASGEGDGGRELQTGNWQLEAVTIRGSM